MSAPIGFPSRRVVLKSLAASSLAAPSLPKLVNAQGLRKTTFALSWLPEGFNAWSFVARAKGFWRDQGLDVQISRGNGSMSAGQALVAGRLEFGVSNCSPVILLASQGAELRALAMLDYDPLMGVAVLDESTIKSPKDLEGKTIGQTLASSDTPFFKPFCAANNVSTSDMRLLNIDAKIRNQALVERKVDAVTGFASSIVATIEASGAKVRMMNYADDGISAYGDLVLTTQPDRVEKDSDLCRRFTAGLLNGLKYTLTNSAEAEEIFMNEVPETKLTANGRQFTRLGMAIHRFGVLASTDPQVHGLGWTDHDQLEQAIDFILKYQGTPNAKRPHSKEIFLNTFLGNVTLTPAEWEKTRADTAFIAGALGKKA